MSGPGPRRFISMTAGCSIAPLVALSIPVRASAQGDLPDSAKLGTVTVAAAAADAAAVQQPAILGSRSKDEILISARRRSESAQNVPIAVSVIGSDQLNKTGTFNVDRVKQLIPTVQFYSSNARNSGVNIRGLGVPFGLTNDGIEPGVGIYVDDVYYSRPAAAAFDFLDVERIEVLRGPQGTLYGKNTTAGALNITTNKPTFDRETRAEISVGNLDFVQAKGVVSGPLSSTVAVRLAVSAMARRGTLYNVHSGQ